jgi:uncharacterized protein with PQ loop repeat
MAWQALGMVGGFLTSLGMVFQVHKTVKEKAIKDISWGLLSLNIVGIFMVLGYSIATTQPAIYIPLLLSIGCNIFLATYKIRTTSPMIRQQPFEEITSTPSSSNMI